MFDAYILVFSPNGNFRFNEIVFGETEAYSLIFFLFMLVLSLSGDRITKTIYRTTERKLRFIKLKCDIYLLRMLSQPTTIYDVIKKLGYSNSRAYNTLQEYLSYGIIDLVGSQRLKSGLVKKFYKLNDLGLELLYVLEKLSENCKKAKT